MEEWRNRGIRDCVAVDSALDDLAAQSVRNALDDTVSPRKPTSESAGPGCFVVLIQIPAIRSVFVSRIREGMVQSYRRLLDQLEAQAAGLPSKPKQPGTEPGCFGVLLLMRASQLASPSATCSRHLTSSGSPTTNALPTPT